MIFFSSSSMLNETLQWQREQFWFAHLCWFDCRENLRNHLNTLKSKKIPATTTPQLCIWIQNSFISQSIIRKKNHLGEKTDTTIHSLESLKDGTKHCFSQMCYFEMFFFSNVSAFLFNCLAIDLRSTEKQKFGIEQQ